MAQAKIVPIDRILAGTNITVATGNGAITISSSGGAGGGSMITGHATLTYNSATRIGLKLVYGAGSFGAAKISYDVWVDVSSTGMQVESGYANHVNTRMSGSSFGLAFSGGATQTVSPLRGGAGTFDCSFSADEPTANTFYPKIRARNSTLVGPKLVTSYWTMVSTHRVTATKV